MNAILIKSFGDPGVLELGQWPDPQPGQQEILVEVHATALNRADTLQRKGAYPPPPGESPILGLEMAGRVVACGAAVSRWKPGDRVCGLLGGGGYAEYAVIHEDMALPIPSNLNYQEAAAIPEVFLTAYQALFWLADLKADEQVLIHAGASGVGTAAIQLAENLGATIWTTASAAKHAICRELGARYCIDYQQKDFAKVIEEQTGKKGVDVIIDFIGGPYFQSNLHALALEGRLVMLAFLGGPNTDQLNLGPVLRKRLSVMGSTLRARSLEYKIRLSQALYQEFWPAFEGGQIRPIIDSVFPLAEAAAAHIRMEANLNKGKIILRVR